LRGDGSQTRGTRASTPKKNELGENVGKKGSPDKRTAAKGFTASRRSPG